MRNVRLDQLLAGTMLAMIVATPQVSLAAPEGIRQIAPPPPSLNGQNIHRREAAPVPPAPIQQRIINVPEPVAQEPAKRKPVVQAPPAPAPEQATSAKADASDADLSALDRPLAANDSQIADRLRDQAKQLDKRFDNLVDRKAVESYYAGRQFAPAWIRDGRLTAGAKAAIARLKNASADALDPTDYPVPEFTTLTGADALAAGDIKLTHSVMTFARHLAVGRIAPTRVSAEVDYGNHTPDPADILKRIPDARDVNAALNSFEPPHEGFKALKAKLAELRGNGPRAEADDRIANGPALKPGDKDARVPQLRERLGVAVAAQPETVQVRDRRTGRLKLVKVSKDDSKTAELVYDRALFNAIKNVQARADIKPTGVIDNRTLAAINGPSSSQKADTVAANMERWRWLPRDLGKAYVMVNIPDFTLKVVHDDRPIWRTKIVAGKPQTPTPLLTAPMDNVVVNPSWYVPQSIIQNELLPLYANDPQIFDRMGLEVKRGPDGHINVVQPPGAANALGRIKFNFPNKFQVYLHDTPEKRLFAADKRAFSHGCMRVLDPTKFGEVVLHMAMAGPAPDSRQIERLVGQDEKIFKLANRPMVHLTYQTAYVDDAGKLVTRDDIYGFDARIKTIMHTDERRVADVAPPQDPKRELATMKSNQEILNRVERREAANPLQFFEKLFR
jgi:murein L,D-transpeptidase YcbB/YkuD